MCAVEDLDPPAVFSETKRRARRDHVCVECGRTIRAGEQYRFVSGLWDGRWSSHKMCRHCDALSGWMTHMCGGWV